MRCRKLLRSSLLMLAILFYNEILRESLVEVACLCDSVTLLWHLSN